MLSLHSKIWLKILAVFSSSLLMTACGQKNATDGPAVQADSSASSEGKTASLTGAGASFPAPVYMKWADEYFSMTGHKINYQSIGSSAGVKQILAKTVDFAASDAPLDQSKLNENGLTQFPTLIGGIVLAVNIEGLESGVLTLDGPTLANIFMGKVKKWDDPAIKMLNPGVALPNRDIVVVRRADGSGTSFVFTTYLSKVSESWKNEIGSGSTVNWPVGVGGKGNDGVSAFVSRLPGAIGYVEYAYAKQNNLSYAKLLSADGEALIPSASSFSAAAMTADWEKSFAQDLTNRPGKNAWPISSTTFIVLYRVQSNAGKGQEILRFFEWGFGPKGRQLLEALDYAPLPDRVIETVKNSWTQEIADKSGRPLYPF